MAMTRDEFIENLSARPAVKLTRHQWAVLGRGFREMESHETGLAGRLQLGTLHRRLVAVEEADATHLAIRSLATREDARAFVKARLEAYERMWDG